MTFNGVMAIILRYFSEFAYLPGVLRKSSRSLSHLLMSSCNNGNVNIIVSLLTQYIASYTFICLTWFGDS